MLLAALFLTAQFFRRDAVDQPRPSSYTYLLLLGTLIAGWVTLAWTFHRLDWGFIFDWFSVRFAEKNVGAFSLVIAFRYGVPLVMARVLLGEMFEGRYRYPQMPITLLAGLKTFSVMLIAFGMAFHHVRSDVYIEAVQQTAIWALLFVVLPWSRKRLPGAGR